MKRKAIYLAVLTAVIVAVGFLSIKKVNALDNAFYNNIYEISSRDLSQVGISLMACPVPKSNGSYRVAYIDAPSRPGFIYFDLTYSSGLTSTFWVNYYDGTNYYTIDSASIYSPYFLMSILPDAQSGELYLYIDYLELDSVTTGQHEVDYWEYSRAYTLDLEDYAFIQDYYDSYLTFEYAPGSSELKGLIQSYYIEGGTILNQLYVLYGDSVNLNYYTYWLQYGYQSGYDVGYDDGEDYGWTLGETVGYQDGYDVGYRDGEAGENAISPMWTIISSIATGIGQILSLELGYGIKIGTLIFVPLFFAVVGFILWIWRH